MADSRKTPEETARRKADKLDQAERQASLRLGLAELDLVWRFTQANGDVGGLRSPMGGQLDAMRLGAVASEGMNVAGSTDRMDEYVEATRRLHCVDARLAQVPARAQRVLHLAFASHGLPGDLPATAVMTATARDAWNGEVRRMARRWVDGTARGRAQSAELTRRRAEEAESPLEALAEVCIHEDLIARRTAAQVEEAAAEAAVRWSADDGLLAEHIRATGRVDRAAIILEAETLTREALQTFALKRCWTARDDAHGATLRRKRCDRCGHRDESRERNERAARGRS